MIEDFIKLYACKIAQKPEAILVKKSVDEANKLCDIVIYADSADVGRLIGKNGKMISSIKTVVSGCKAKDGFSYKIVVEAI